MKLLLATASLDDVRWAAAAGLLDGVFTTPARLYEESHALRDHVVALGRLSAVPVHVSVHAVVGDDVHREARELGRLYDQIVVHLPLVEDAIGTMHRLRAEGVRVAATFVYTPAQAILAARAGASAVVTPLADAAAAGLNGFSIIRDIRRALDAAKAECDLIAYGPASPAALAEAVTAGADAVAASADLLRSALLHPATDRSVDAFLRDVTRHPRPWIPE